MLGLGSVGNIGNLIGAVIALGITAIVLLTFAPTVAGDVDGIFNQAKNACVYGGERFTQIVVADSDEANDAWLKSGGNTVLTVSNNSGECDTGHSITSGNRPSTIKYFTPQGTAITLDGTGGASSSPHACSNTDVCSSEDFGEWKAPSASISALAGGSLVLLLLGAMAILLPAGALGFLAYTGAEMVRGYIGGSTLAIAIGTTVTVVVVGAILPEIFTPLDTLFSVMDGHRFKVYDEGIGKLAGVLGNFFGISLLAGLVALGAMLWKNSHSSNEGM